MSDASFRNLAAAMRERDRRIGLSLASPGTPGIAQAGYLSPSWDAFYGTLREQAGEGGYRLSGAGSSLDGDPGGSTQRPGDADTGRSLAINQHLSQLADQNVVRAQSLRDMDAHNSAVQQQQQDRSAQDRALAIANAPGVTATGRPIQGGNGSYATAAPTGEPVNRQAIAAQMAPGVIAPPVPEKVTFGKPEPRKVGDKTILTQQGSDGLLYGMDRKPIEADSVAADDTTNPDVKDAVAGMIAGTLPPQLPGRASKEYMAILGEAKRQGYDLSRAATDWTATQKHVQTMNGAQQLRLNQAVNALPEMLDSVDTLATKWAGGKFPILNKANLALAKAGTFGPDAASIANQLEAQIADVTADLGNVYMGGNSPTDHALSLAEKSLKGDWDEKVIHDMVKLAKQNVQIRRNSINNTGVAGASPDNPYGNQEAPPAPAGFVDMVDDKGAPLHVPAADVDKLLALGAKRKGGG